MTDFNQATQDMMRLVSRLTAMADACKEAHDKATERECQHRDNGDSTSAEYEGGLANAFGMVGRSLAQALKGESAEILTDRFNHYLGVE